MSDSQISLPIPTVSLIDNRPATTSLAIAEYFEKEHKNVVRDIRILIGDCPEDFTRLNFEPSEYTDPTGRKLPMYNVFFDGFVLLVMGYTGKKALQMKLAYIAAFNALREKVESGKLVNQDAQPITPDQQNVLLTIMRTRVDAFVHANKGTRMQFFASGWSRFNNHFRIAKYCQLPQSKMSEAIEYLVKLELPAKGVKKEDKPPLYRDGVLYMLERDPNAPAGPREKALRTFWKKDFTALTSEMEQNYKKVMSGIDDAYGDLFPQVVSALAKDSNALFNPDFILERMYSLEGECRYHFTKAMSCLHLHLMSTMALARALNK